MSGSVPYLIAGFGLSWGALLLYAWRLEARIGRARDRLGRRGDDGSRVRAAGDAARGPDAERGSTGVEDRR